MPVEDIEGMLNTAVTNPDTTHFACPPDGMTGTSTITQQKIARTVKFNNPAVLEDIWIVQWDHEPLTASDCTGTFMLSNAAIASVDYRAGKLKFLPTDWASAGYATSIVTGGLCVYHMAQGKSPFPASDGSGPWPPISVDQLVFSEDMFHDLCRVLGANHELIDTTNALNQQGNCFQGAWESNQHLGGPWHIESSVVTGGDFATQVCPLGGRSLQLPPGLTDDLVKTAENRTASAKQGQFTMCRVDYSDNRPSSGFSGHAAVYESISNHPAANGLEVFLVVNPQPYYQTNNELQFAVVNNPTQQCKIYSTAVQLNTTVFTGLNSTWAATISREVVTQCFVKPNSPYIAFAKKNNAVSDSATVDILTNVVAEIPMFHPSKSNANGKFAKMAKGLWKKASKVIKPVAGIAARELVSFAPPAVQRAMSAVEKIVNEANSNRTHGIGPMRDIPGDFLDAAVAKAKKKSKAKAAAAKSSGKK